MENNPNNMRLNLTKKEIETRGGLLDEIIDGMPNPSILVDKEGMVLYANKQVRKTFHTSEEDRLGTPIRSKDSREQIMETLQSGHAVLDKLVHIDGYRVLNNNVPIYENGQVIGALCTQTIPDIGRLSDIVAQLSTTSKDKKLYNILSRTVSKYNFNDFLGASEAAKTVVEQCKLAAKSDYAVLILGETGCGKEILAGAIHEERTQYVAKPFVKINCTAIPDNLMESELFGYEKGAFTGAGKTRIGKFEQAEDGTILLDEIGDMNIALQSKLLRVLEEREFERVGGDTMIPLQANIIATTNKDLIQMSERNEFRMDLYYRLAVLEIHVPPLRDRKEDILPLFRHFMEEQSSSFRLTEEAAEYLQNYDWPGNVRELLHLVMRLSVLYANQDVSSETLIEYFRNDQKDSDYKENTISSETNLEKESINEEKSNKPSTESLRLDEVEKTHIQRRLNANGGNIRRTAEELGISRATLYNKIQKYHL